MHDVNKKLNNFRFVFTERLNFIKSVFFPLEIKRSLNMSIAPKAHVINMKGKTLMDYDNINNNDFLKETPKTAPKATRRGKGRGPDDNNNNKSRKTTKKSAKKGRDLLNPSMDTSPVSDIGTPRRVRAKPRNVPKKTAKKYLSKRRGKSSKNKNNRKSKGSLPTIIKYNNWKKINHK